MDTDLKEALRNYAILVFALALPMFAFHFLPQILLSVSSLISVGFVLLIAYYTRLRDEAEAVPAVRHLRIQRWVLLLILLGGILSALQVVLAGEQLRSRFNFTSLVWLLAWLAWGASVVLTLQGIAGVYVENRNRQRAQAG
jgi:peptidoglycan biosynthesis protein MviN/MurJ (putative lipid II flippase)